LTASQACITHERVDRQPEPARLYFPIMTIGNID